MADRKFGKIVQIIGPVIDVEFEAGHLPEIYHALRVYANTKETGLIDVIAEVEQHLGENRVRAVAMKPTDGMQRGSDYLRRRSVAKRTIESIGRRQGIGRTLRQQLMDKYIHRPALSE